MTFNPSNCKELSFMKKGNAQIFDWVAGIPQVKDLVLLGVTFQSDTRFNTLLFLYKNVVFPAQAEYSYFSADFRLKIFLYYS